MGKVRKKQENAYLNKLLTRMKCVQCFIQMNFNSEENSMAFQMMYNQLLAQYSSLASNYHTVAQENFQLFSKLQKLMEDKISLMKPNIHTTTTLPAEVQPSEEHVIAIPTITSSPSQKISNRSKTHRNKSKAKLFNCTYPSCSRIYRSSVSLNLHIKLKHNGGTKRERQNMAKSLIDSEEKGEPKPENSLNLPPNFLQQYRKTYEYEKKYNM